MNIDSYTQYKGDDKDIKYGLFGTVNSSWRTRFIKYFEENNIPYFNPNKKEWKPEDALEEAKNLDSNETLLFSILDNEYGIASVFEVLIAAENRNNTDKYVSVFIDKLSNFYNSTPEEDQKIIKGINNAEKILKAHSKYNKDLALEQIEFLSSFKNKFSKKEKNVVNLLNELRGNLIEKLNKNYNSKNIIIVDSLDKMFDYVELKNYNFKL